MGFIIFYRIAYFISRGQLACITEMQKLSGIVVLHKEVYFRDFRNKPNLERDS
jgi:hypothetical protein